jgi:hypothetical protein
MIRRSWTRPASIEKTLALWAASLREIKKRIRPLFNQDRVARNAGLFLESLLGDEQRKTGWMRAEDETGFLDAIEPAPRSAASTLRDTRTPSAITRTASSSAKCSMI